jgi:sulfite exporter TauE/SafE
VIDPIGASGQISLAAAFVAGVAGSVHCLAMCGGLSGALGMRARRLGKARGQALLHAASSQAGRIFSYSIAGLLCGSAGRLLTSLLDLARVALIVRIAAGLLLIAIALRVLLGWRLLGSLERWGGRLWVKLAPLARASDPANLSTSVLLGMIWGWLPCGLLYSMLIFSALTGSAFQGAATMLLFGLGTWPAMLGGSLFSARIGRVTTARGMNAIAGWLLFAFGVITVLAPLQHAHH